VSDSQKIGKIGEDLAVEYIKRRGYKILSRNWKSKRWGELDIVAQDRGTLVFLEVKTRSLGSLGKPFEAVNYYKIKSLLKTAQNYKLQNPNTPEQLRVDVISIVLATPPEIEYFESIYQE